MELLNTYKGDGNMTLLSILILVCIHTLQSADCCCSCVYIFSFLGILLDLITLLYVALKHTTFHSKYVLNKFPFYGTYLEYFLLCVLYYTVSGHIHTVYPNAHFMSSCSCGFQYYMFGYTLKYMFSYQGNISVKLGI